MLLYDLRSDKPLLVKDHQYGLPIKSVHFQDSLDLVLSADSRIVKMWNKDSVRTFCCSCSLFSLPVPSASFFLCALAAPVGPWEGGAEQPSGNQHISHFRSGCVCAGAKLTCAGFSYGASWFMCTCAWGGLGLRSSGWWLGLLSPQPSCQAPGTHFIGHVLDGEKVTVK